MRLGSCVQWIHHEEFYKFDYNYFCKRTLGRQHKINVFAHMDLNHHKVEEG